MRRDFGLLVLIGLQSYQTSFRELRIEYVHRKVRHSKQRSDALTQHVTKTVWTNQSATDISRQGRSSKACNKRGQGPDKSHWAVTLLGD